MGVTMGSRTQGDAFGIILTTSADLNPSNGCSSGAIFKKVLVTMFEIASTDRIAGKANVALTFSFTSTVQGALAPNSSITLAYPFGFFSSFTNISVSLSGGASGVVSAPTFRTFVIITSSLTLPAGSAITVTLKGLTMGSTSTSETSDGIIVTTSSDGDPSDGISSGMIGGQVSTGLFIIAGMGHIAGKTIAAITFSFTPSVGGALPPGSKIKLMFSSGFLALSNSSYVSISGGALGNATAPTLSSIFITTSKTTLPSSAAITVTLVGFIMDSSNGGSSGGVIISTSADTFSVAYWGGCMCNHAPVIDGNLCAIAP
jgi:hypothetical protein